MKKGAITVFMILITTSILTLGGTLIDLGRIVLANYTVSSAAETATRSLMANYDADLAGEYGLFAIEKTEDNTKEFNKYLKRNLNADDNNKATGKNFSLLKFKNASLIESETTVVYEKPISDQKVFKQQVLDYHVPRTIVIAADRVISQVTDLLKSATIENLLGKADKAKTATDSVVSKKDSVNTKLEMYNRIKDKPERYAEMLWKKAYKSLKSSLEKSIAKNGISATFSVANREIFAKTQLTDLSGINDAADEAYKELDLMLETVNQSTNELNSIKADGNTEQYNEYTDGDDWKNYVKEGTSNSEIVERINQIKDNIEAAQKTVEEKKAAFNTYSEDEVSMQAILSAYELYSEGVMTYAEFTKIVSSHKNLITNQEIITEVTNAQTLLAESENNEPTDEVRVGLETARTKCYTGMNKQVTDITNIDIGTIMEIEKTEPKTENPKTEEQETNISDIYNKITMVKNLLLKDNNNYQIYKEGTGNSVFDNFIKVIANYFGISFFKDMVDTVKSFSEDNLAKQIVYASYVMDKTNNITSSTKRQHYFNFAETEYVLHGYSIEGLNAIQSVVDVLKWRFTIDTAYYLMFRSPPAAEGITFLVKLGYAVTRGGIKAVEDVFNMVVMGQNIPFIPITSGTKSFLGEIISVSYSDHIMIAMVFEGKKIPRTINTINATIAQKAELENKTKSLTNMYTKVKTKVTVDCDLVFLNIFGFRDILGNVYDGKYRIVKENVFSY